MKTRIIIIIAAVFAVLLAVGCSNDQRIASPTDNNSEQIAANIINKGKITMNGTYHLYNNQCPFLLVNKTEPVELTFLSDIPDFVKADVHLEISGHYAVNQQSECAIGPMFNVTNIKLYTSDQYVPPSDREGPKINSSFGPRPILVLGTFHRVGASCAYIEINKDKQVEVQFRTSSPIELADGDIVEALGYYSSLPVTPCQLGVLFIVTSYTELSDRYNPPSDGGDIASLGPELLTGTFQRLGANCRYLQVSEGENIELYFPISSPSDPQAGDIVRVYGFYSSIPGSECGFATTLVVNSFQIIEDQYLPPGDGEQPLGGNPPEPSVLVGTYHFSGSCRYLESAGSKQIELLFENETPQMPIDGVILSVSGFYKALPYSQCGFPQAFLVQQYKELSEQSEQPEDDIQPAGFIPGDEIVTIRGGIYFGQDGCAYLEVSKTQQVELRLMITPPQTEVKPGTQVEAVGHFLSNAESDCIEGPVFEASKVKFYSNNQYFPPTENERPTNESYSPIVLLSGYLGHWGGSDGCPYLEVGKEQFVELSFLHDAPIDHKDGTYLEVSGYYTVNQSSECLVGPMLVVASMNDAPVTEAE